MPSFRNSSAPSTSSESRRRRRGSIQSSCADSALVPAAQLSDASFETEVLQSSTPYLVDVWAQWCGPCRLMAPLMDWAAAEYAGRLLVGKLEADPNPASRDRLQVQGLPTLVLFKGGEPVARHEGAMAQAQLKAFLDAHL
ncbi:thiol reductase thioredoxin [Cyanobium sp. ATX 6A2]|nr:thiol reductase thioredoxin [Cyanobium sp. ATX 6A2]